MSEILESDEERKIALDIAWESIRAAVTGAEYKISIEKFPSVFAMKSGAFVTVYKVEHGREELRGCIGVPKPILPLAEAIASAARDTVIADPRFSRVRESELKDLVVEVEVLSAFHEIKFNNLQELYDQVTIGTDGLVLYSKFGSGLLLPPVPVKYNWNAEEFIDALCKKAWVDKKILLDKKTQIMKFQAQVIR